MLCVTAKLDKDSTERLAGIRSAAARFGLPVKPLYGHITLASYIGDDVPFFISSCKEMLSGFRAFEVFYEKIEVLGATDIIVASPRPEGALLRMHRLIAERFSSGLDKWTKPGAWKPHTTLVYKPDADLFPIAEAMSALFVPFCASVETVEFSLVKESGYELAGRIALR